jgi:hypothetical protein
VKKLLPYIISYFFLCSGFPSEARKVDDQWFQGSVQLTTSSVLHGLVSVREEYNVILYKVGKEVMVLPAHKVVSFRFYDPEELSLKKFISLQLQVGAQTTYRFYELLAEGEVSILRKQQIGWQSLHIEIIEYDYFVLHEGKLRELFKFRKTVFPELIARTDGEMKLFAKRHRLNPSKLEDVVKIATHYNTLSTSQTLAKN